MNADDEREFWGDEPCDKEPFDYRYVIYLIVAATLIWVAGIFVAPGSDAAGSEFPVGNRWVQPYGGCKEAWQAPSSEGAAECRAHGWLIRPRLVVGPHGVVRFTALPHCRQEDGSGQRSACTWNVRDGAGRDGDGSGLTYWLDARDHTHYVWPLNATAWWYQWRWVSSALSDALAEGEEYGATERDWQRCMVTDTRRVKEWLTCPDGYQTEVY